jgi:serine/threonine-protein kinase ULK/ATG1
LSKLNKKLKDNLYTEIEILKGLHHPHIVALIDCRESPTYIHLVMEYCELGDLSYFIKKRDKLADNPALREMVRKYPMPPSGGLNEVVVRHFLKQLASAMEFLRGRGLIHRDVKPQNLLLLPSPTYLAKAKDRPLVMSASRESLYPRVGLESLPVLKLADFGFARSLPPTSLAETLCGSPLYMAPEILRYEKYDAKADLWSIGTVLYEMMTGKPPFRAGNHVELLRKIEMLEDQIKFPREPILSAEMKDLIRGLLKRKPVQRLEFVDFFRHVAVVEDIPGLVGEDVPLKERPRDIASVSRTSSTRSNRPGQRRTDSPTYSSSPRDQPQLLPSSPRVKKVDPVRQLPGTPPTAVAQALTTPRRPQNHSSATAPNPETLTGMPVRKPSTATRRESVEEGPKGERPSTDTASIIKARMDADQAVADAREYVMVDTEGVKVNAFADELAANLRSPLKQTPQPQSRDLRRRSTTQGGPVSTTGAVAAEPSKTMQIASGNPRPDSLPQRTTSYGRSYGSPSATSAIAKALHGASVRMFGHRFSPDLISKGVSPPQIYSPFPVYPTPMAAIGLLSDGRNAGPLDEDQKAVSIIEESATRSDVVYGFAEVKYKQLIPMAPSMEHGLGGPLSDRLGESGDDEGLTVEAVIALSEEALVLYVKALSLLAKSMDFAGAWWSRKSRGETNGRSSKPDSTSSTNTGNRINSAVQWVRNRFNEVLEKAEFVRQKLLDAQKQLPEDHPSHPSNHTSSSKLGSASSTDGVILSSGVTAEKLMYDRAIEMSRSAAINEIANEDLHGCEISYITAIRMLEAVLENDDELPQRHRASSLRNDRDIPPEGEGVVNGINVDDRQAVMKGIYPIFIAKLFYLTPPPSHSLNAERHANI